MSDTKYQGDATPVVDPLDKGLGALDAACAPEQMLRKAGMSSRKI